MTMANGAMEKVPIRGNVLQDAGVVDNGRNSSDSVINVQQPVWDVTVDDGVAHVRIKRYGSLPSLALMRESMMPVINQLEKVMPVRVHGIPPCLLPDAFELVVPDVNGMFRAGCRACSLKGVCRGFPVQISEGSLQSTSGGSVREEGVEAFGMGSFMSRLREVGIEVNRACLFACPFCFYQNFYEKEDRGFVPKEKILALLDEMCLHRVPMVRFFGGDPVLRSDFPEIVEYAKALGLFSIVNTNGLFRDAASRRRILEAADSIIISVHGCDEHSEQVLTGRGDLLIPVLASLRGMIENVPEKVVVSTLMTRFLIANKARYAELFRRLGVRSWFVSRPLFMQKEIDQHAWLGITPTDVQEFADFASGWMEKTSILVVLNNLPWCMLEKRHWRLLQHNAQTNSMTRLFYDVRGFFKTGPSDGHIGVFMAADGAGKTQMLNGLLNGFGSENQNGLSAEKQRWFESKEQRVEGQGGKGGVGKKQRSESKFNIVDGRRNLGSNLMEAWGKSPFRIIGQGAPVPKECLSCSVYLQCLGGSRTQAMSSFGRIDAGDPWMVGPVMDN